eukprot:tig00021012_g16980.t1
MGGTSATLSWSPPSSGAPASYLVLQDGQPVASVPGTETSAPVSGLSSDRAATLQVVPVDPNGSAGAPSYPLSAAPSPSPSSGINLTASPASPSNGSASLSWNTPSGVPASSLTGYAVMMNGQQVGTAPATGSPTNTFAVKGVPAAGPAVFSVVPLTPSGPASSAASSPVPLAPYTGAGSPGAGSGAGAGPFSPAAPSNLQLTSVSSGLMGGTSATLSWSPPAAGAPQSYQVLKDGVPVGSVPGSKTSTTVSDLPRGGVANLSVAPVRADGTSGPTSAPLAAGIPSNPASELVLTAVPASATSAKLSWNRPPKAPPGSAPGSGSPASFAVMQNGQQVATVPAGGATSSFTATNLQPNVPAVFSVVPLSPSGSPIGPASVPVPVTPSSGAGAGGPGSGAPSPAAPSNLQLTSVSSGLMGGTSATLSWSPPSSGAPASYLVLQDGQPVASVPGTETSAPVSGLSSDRAATLQVVPVDPSGSASSPSYPLSAAPSPSPSSGINLTASPASPSNGSASLSWNTPSGVPASSLTGYAVMMNGQQVGTAPATGSPTNTFAVKGVPAAGPAVFSVVPLTPSGPASSAASSPVPLAPYTGAGSPGAGSGAGAGPFSPAAPSNLQLTSVSSGLMGGTSATLSWSPPAAGAPQSYQVLKDGVPVGSVSGSKTSTTVSDLPSGGVATLSVAPVRADGTSGPASAPLAAGIPSNPASELVLTAVPASATSAKLSWNRPPKAPPGSAPGSGSPASFAVMQNGQQVATVPAGGATSSFTATNLQPNVPAVFSVVPLSPSGSPIGPASVPVPVTPSSGAGAGGPGSGAPSPAAPSNLQLTSVSSGLMGGTSATLSWSPPSSGAPASYLVLQDGQPVASVPGTETSAPISGLSSDRAATLQVVPVDPNGSASSPSYPLSAAPSPSPSSGINLTASPASPSNGSASLSWNTPSGVPASSLTGYAVMMNGQQVGTAPATGSPTNTFAVKGVPAAGPAVFSVVPLTPSGPASSAASSPVPLAPYTGAGSPGAGSGAGAGPFSPAAPSNLQLTSVSSGLMGGTSATLSWSPPAAGAPQSYQVLKDGVPVGSVSGSKTSTTVSDLPAAASRT